jgi:dTDP-4-amino-4,6-dideoxygalactose transaminase
VTWEIPLAGDRAQEEDVEAVLECLRSGWLTMGPRIADFETAFAMHLGARSAVAVSSGAAALRLACHALSLGPGDEVVLPALASRAAAQAVRGCGATPVPCAAGSARCPVPAVDDVERAITAHTRAVLVRHPWGYPADSVGLRALCERRGLALIEDARDALGAQVGDGRAAGTVGHVGCFSCRAGRQLAVGEGGVVVAAEPQAEARVRLQRSHAMTSGTWDRHRGHADFYDIVDLGFNHRMDEPRAALGLARLPRVDAEVRARRELAATYRRALTGEDVTPCFDAAADRTASPLCFPVLARARDARAALAAGLAARGIETATADGTARTFLLPLGPHVTSVDVEVVLAGLTDAPAPT